METSLHYNKTLHLHFDAKKHHYTADLEGKYQDKTFDGVTSVLGIIAKPALVYWAANKAAEYIDANLPVNTAIDEVQKVKLIEGAKTAHRSFLKDAADYGTLLHNWIEKYIKGQNPEIPTNETLKKAVEQFLEWKEKHKVKFLESEKKVASLKYEFCGTCDLIAEIDDKVVLGDIKTSSGVWNEYWLQTAAYKGAYLEEFPDKKIDHTLILRCGKDGVFEVKELNDFEKNYNAFVAALILYRREKEMKFLNYINNN